MLDLIKSGGTEIYTFLMFFFLSSQPAGYLNPSDPCRRLAKRPNMASRRKRRVHRWPALTPGSLSDRPGQRVEPLFRMFQKVPESSQKRPSFCLNRDTAASIQEGWADPQAHWPRALGIFTRPRRRDYTTVAVLWNASRISGSQMSQLWWLYLIENSRNYQKIWQTLNLPVIHTPPANISATCLLCFLSSLHEHFTTNDLIEKFYNEYNIK